MFLPYRYTEEEDFEKGFAQYYHEHIVPLGEKHNPKRKKRQIFHHMSAVTAVISGFGMSFLMIKSAWFAKLAQGNRKSGIILLLPPIFLWWFLVQRPRRKYFQALKEDIVPKILKFFGDFKYSVSGDISEHLFSTHTGYNYLFKLFSCEDVISFKKNDLSCTVLERTFWDIKKPTGKVFIYIKSKHSFDVDAVIISKARDKVFRAADKKLLIKRNLNCSAALVGLFFDEHFLMHTNDVRINKLLSEEFIKNLMLLNSVFDKDGMVLSIKNNEIFIELESKGNLFEIGTNHSVPVANPADIRNFLRELTTIKSLVDNLAQAVQSITETSCQSMPEDKATSSVSEPETDYLNETFTWSGRE